MNLYHISQTIRDGYDTYDSAVVAAPNEETAKTIHPDGETLYPWIDTYNTWCQSPNQVSVKLIGVAAPNIQQGVVIASFNAG